MKFILATAVRNEGPYLLEWIAHHKLLGFDRIIIYSNDNDDGSDALLAALRDEGLIDWRPRVLKPGQKPQLSAFNGLSRELLADKEQHGNYLAWFDCDEFLILRKHQTVQELLSYYSFPDALYVNWKHFGSSGINRYSPDLTVDRFLQCSSTFVFNTRFKSISKVDPTLFKNLLHHRPSPKNEELPVRIIYAASKPEGQVPPRDITHRSLRGHINKAPFFHEVCHLNHYAIRSKEEYQWKISRGNGWKANDDKSKHFNTGYFAIRDNNDEQDRFASEKYSESIKNYLASLPENIRILGKQIIDSKISMRQS